MKFNLKMLGILFLFIISIILLNYLLKIQQNQDIIMI